MANIKSAKKRARQAVKATERNVALRSRLRTMIKKVKTAIDSGDAASAKKQFQAAVPIIDGMVNKRVIHKNAAARYKSNLNAQVKKLALAK